MVAATAAAYLVFACASLVLAVIDVRARRLPDKIVLPCTAGILVLLSVAALTPGAGADWSRLAWTLGGAAALFAAYLVIALVFRGGLGGGDVKLAALIGAVSGFLGWQALVLSFMLPFVFNATYTLGLLLLRRLKRTSEIPFGPFMLLGTWVSVLATVCSG